ncbi:hypothetical protein DEU56DRAFT_902739 [Suillus clintonianus]|uniref:uncharacterized protein n=1 Tax=Suillus clintonianus TaxID=1904413 RepID=UPI001B870C3C|nr:uncharacterized protein DEU56DRAFT_905619 [Suillus clintonianus]XP_041206230.1 uncharacterized protein DEU56DRAFT_902739 [Suillus clintonianus]KAG2109813.1 hypothetical protein DEU56DRAFT_905619 [Suillus clintonianus]KAG2130275.1 hypothetical protein DEU56DRAFT_902739 [Suillus clintonianus]
MSSHPAVRFNDPPVTDCNAMDVDDSSMGRVSPDDLDGLYLGPEDDLEHVSMSSGPPGAMADIPDQSDPGQADDAGYLVDPDLYLGPEDDVIDVDELPDSAYPPSVSPAASDVSSSSETSSTELPADKPELDIEDLRLMVREFHPFGKYQHEKYRLGDYKRRTGGLPDPSIQLLLEAERPFRTAWAETSDKLKKADADLQRLQRVEQMSIEMLKVVDSLIALFEEDKPK